MASVDDDTHFEEIAKILEQSAGNLLYLIDSILKVVPPEKGSLIKIAVIVRKYTFENNLRSSEVKK